MLIHNADWGIMASIQFLNLWWILSDLKGNFRKTLNEFAVLSLSFVCTGLRFADEYLRIVIQMQLLPHFCLLSLHMMLSEHKCLILQN